MVKELVAGIIYTANSFPTKGSVSENMSPGMIVEGRPKPDLNKKRINFGSFAFVYTGTNNNMKTRSVPAIALRQSNQDGGHYFMNIETGQRMNCYDWDELPITESAIKMVEKRAKK